MKIHTHIYIYISEIRKETPEVGRAASHIASNIKTLSQVPSANSVQPLVFSWHEFLLYHYNIWPKTRQNPKWSVGKTVKLKSISGWGLFYACICMHVCNFLITISFCSLLVLQKIIEECNNTFALKIGGYEKFKQLVFLYIMQYAIYAPASVFLYFSPVGRLFS